jgi:hypothetical protein
MTKDKPYRILQKTVDENGVDCWYMDETEYADKQLAFSDSIAKTTDGPTMISKIVFPED